MYHDSYVHVHVHGLCTYTFSMEKNVLYVHIHEYASNVYTCISFILL